MGVHDVDSYDNPIQITNKGRGRLYHRVRRPSTHNGNNKQNLRNRYLFYIHLHTIAYNYIQLHLYIYIYKFNPVKHRDTQILSNSK